MPMEARSSVLFPQPFGPQSTVTFPAGKLRLTSSITAPSRYPARRERELYHAVRPLLCRSSSHMKKGPPMSESVMPTGSS